MFRSLFTMHIMYYSFCNLWFPTFFSLDEPMVSNFGEMEVMLCSILKVYFFGFSRFSL
jgi:hypothetical protein